MTILPWLVYSTVAGSIAALGLVAGRCAGQAIARRLGWPA